LIDTAETASVLRLSRLRRQHHREPSSAAY